MSVPYFKLFLSRGSLIMSYIWYVFRKLSNTDIKITIEQAQAQNAI